ncbi:putative pre-mRNA-processing factor 39-like [Apostichopus japonicus]|uniref:Putative pre-mRNA-processing factor 39-like n=1 Tax=Stichopus japonicus TaxID=307972 RepID=A0A2G8JKA0_STIJA|nr:putative pre-mRNA-processing factor 39-like [Apostichopus japonicus]
MSDIPSEADPSSPEKEEKQADKEKDSSDKSSDDESEENKSKEPVKPPELQKYWEAVRNHPGDFTGWTYLLQYVEQKNIIGFYREAFDEFFQHYPYCYGYWKKYGETERKHGNSALAYEVYERGVKAIPLCSDLWIHYITFQMQNLLKDENREAKIRELFERAIKVCGLDFRSDKLWEYYIKFEVQHQHFTRVTNIYDRLLNIPTQQLSTHMIKFKEFIRSHSPRKTLSLDEFLKHRTEYVSNKENGDVSTENGVEGIPGIEALPGEDGPPGEEVEMVEEGDSKEKEDLPPGTDLAPPGEDDKEKEELSDEKELEAIKELATRVREEIFTKTEEELNKRLKFEEQIRRPYFHAKPLEKGQIKNWKEYLDYEIENGSMERTIVLFERCLVACALYEEMWLKYAKHMETTDPEAASEIYQRACTIHLPKKPMLHLNGQPLKRAKVTSTLLEKSSLMWSNPSQTSSL